MKFSGCYTALATPFTRAGALDEAALRRLVRRQAASGVAGLVPCGSTGEAATLSAPEWRRVISIAISEARGLPVIAGVGTNDTAKAVAQAKEARDLGADALLLLAPYYNKPTQDGLYAHFSAVARAVPLPIVIYNIPGRTAVNVLPQTLLKLAAARRNVAAVKEASGNVDQASELARAGTIAVLSGDDALTLPMMALGARGVVSVASNVVPKKMAALCAAALAGDFARARRIHHGLAPLFKALFIETNPIALKAALNLMGLCENILRLPLTKLRAENRALLAAALKA